MGEQGSGKKQHDVFLSHASAGKDWVGQLAAALEGLGISAYLGAKELEPGPPFPKQLSDGSGGDLRDEGP